MQTPGQPESVRQVWQFRCFRKQDLMESVQTFSQDCCHLNQAWARHFWTPFFPVQEEERQAWNLYSALSFLWEGQVFSLMQQAFFRPAAEVLPELVAGRVQVLLLVPLAGWACLL